MPPHLLLNPLSDERETLRQCQAIRGEAARHRADRRTRRDPNRAGRGSPGRLRRRTDGVPPGHGEAQKDAAFRDDTGALAEVGPAAQVEVERAGLG